ncbi:MAG: response regulator [Pseudomonadota bacterium]|nr:response regulator [Pseudomonadota bacterium]
MDRTTVNPRLLLVEDDPISQVFLADAARALPADITSASSVAEAIGLATAQAFDGWLIDAHLPDGSGIELLARLRHEALARDAFALAHTASQDRHDLGRLRDAGFAHVVSKPLSVAAWQAAVRDALVLASPATPATWNDAAALCALNGNAESVAALRALFIGELPAQRKRVLAAIASGDLATARDELHRLKASCGFVGAEALAAAVARLHGDPTSVPAREAFADAVDDVLRQPAD